MARKLSKKEKTSILIKRSAALSEFRFTETGWFAICYDQPISLEVLKLMERK